MKFARLICFALLTATLVGCVSSDQPMTFRDGARGYHVYCGGHIYKSKSDCLRRAEDRCEGGYTVMAEGNPAYSHTESWFDLSTHDIIVRCNNKP